MEEGAFGRGGGVVIGSHGTVPFLGAGWSQWTTSTKQGTHLCDAVDNFALLHV